MASTIPLPQPTLAAPLNASQSAIGVPITPLQRLRIMDDKKWESFVLEWASALTPTYTDVVRCGGGGDLGRDVIGFKAGINPQSAWDNYQCKHYAQPVSVADVVAELGKVLYHASQGAFCLPDGYYFVAPQGPGTALIKCLQKGLLKQELCDRWDKECSTAITKGTVITLATVQATINAFDFARVPHAPAIEAHRRTSKDQILCVPFRWRPPQSHDADSETTRRSGCNVSVQRTHLTAALRPTGPE